MEPVLIVHGGAKDVNDENLAKSLLEGVKVAAKEGYKVLLSTGSVLDAVENSVKILEDNEIYNAGRGSVLNLDGEVEMDASIMLGSNLNAGAVTVVKNIKNPISLARKVMEQTPHVLLAGEGAVKFAQEQNFEILPADALVTDRARTVLENIKRNISQSRSDFGTVGAVAIDSQGRLAAATSTGGYEGKMVGRSSDTCIIGSGTYADDDFGAVSTTGHGESIAKFCLAHTIIREIGQGKSAQDATQDSVRNMTEKLKNYAGAITISKNGDVGVGFSTKNMTWAYIKGNTLNYGIEPNQHEIENVE